MVKPLSIATKISSFTMEAAFAASQRASRNKKDSSEARKRATQASTARTSSEARTERPLEVHRSSNMRARRAGESLHVRETFDALSKRLSSLKSSRARSAEAEALPSKAEECLDRDTHRPWSPE